MRRKKRDGKTRDASEDFFLFLFTFQLNCTIVNVATSSNSKHREKNMMGKK